jgi:hypothetical protein
VIQKLAEQIGYDEECELRELHKRIEALSHIPFEQVLKVNYLITPLRRTLQAMKHGATNFQLTPPPAPAVNRNAPTSSSNEAQRAVASHKRQAA